MVAIIFNCLIIINEYRNTITRSLKLLTKVNQNQNFTFNK